MTLRPRPPLGQRGAHHLAVHKPLVHHVAHAQSAEAREETRGLVDGVFALPGPRRVRRAAVEMHPRVEAAHAPELEHVGGGFEAHGEVEGAQGGEGIEQVAEAVFVVGALLALVEDEGGRVPGRASAQEIVKQVKHHREARLHVRGAGAV